MSFLKRKKQPEAVSAPPAVPHVKPSFSEYPKWVKGVVVDNAAEEKALLDGTAILSEVYSAAGITRRVVGRK